MATTKKQLAAIGFEGSANKIGANIITLDGTILSNPRHTNITLPGQGFLSRETAQHHLRHLLPLVCSTLQSPSLAPANIDSLCYTKGPRICGRLHVSAVAVRVLSQLWGKPIIAVNHYVAHIEMGRVVTGAEDPVVLYVSGGNTYVIAYSKGRYRIFWETIDIAVGNCLDQFARVLTLSNDPILGYNIEQANTQGANTPITPKSFIPYVECTLYGWARRLIAHGLIQYTDPNLLIHGKNVGSGNFKIALTEVVDSTCQLELPDGFHESIGEVGVGGFVVWPEHSIEVMNG